MQIIESKTDRVKETLKKEQKSPFLWHVAVDTLLRNITYGSLSSKFLWSTIRGDAAPALRNIRYEEV